MLKYIFTNQMKNAGLFVILFFRRKDFEKSTCFLLAGFVQDYKYPTVDAFLQDYKQGKSEYEAYVKATKDWESKYGEKSTHRKLAEKQAEVQKREQDRVFNYRSPADRGAR